MDDVQKAKKSNKSRKNSSKMIHFMFFFPLETQIKETTSQKTSLPKQSKFFNNEEAEEPPKNPLKKQGKNKINKIIQKHIFTQNFSQKTESPQRSHYQRVTPKTFRRRKSLS